MRITTGIYKGRDLKAPLGIRPTKSVVRKAVFDILGDVSGLSFLELFAGSGAVGFEALSRGVKGLTLVESNRSCQLAIKKSMELLKAETCILLPIEAERAIAQLYKTQKKFDIIFLDPPYCRDLATPNSSGGIGMPPSAATPNLKGKVGVPLSAAKKSLQALDAYDILSPGGLIIIQHSDRENLPETLGVLSLLRQSKYGDTLLSFYRKRVS